MSSMKLLRRCKKPSYWLPDCDALRTIQSPWHVTPNDATRSFRITSAAFNPGKDDNSVSVDIGQLLREDALEPDILYPALKQSVGLAAITVELIRQIQLDLHHAPVFSNWYHGGIVGNFNNRKKSRKLAEFANEHVLRPIDADLARKHWESMHGPLAW